jgi:hypothetical protein
MVESLREEYDFPIFLNADHTHSLLSAIEAAKAGFDWIVFDVSTLPFEETQTAELVNEPSSGTHGENGTDCRHHQRPAKTAGERWRCAEAQVAMVSP